jgi:hypothetical protein
MRKKLLIGSLLILLVSGCQTAASPTVAETSEPTNTPLPTKDVTPTPVILLSGLSPIGEQVIVFSSDVTGDDEIYVINSDGSELLQVTHLPNTDEILPQWSPNGEMISWITHEQGLGGEKYTVVSVEGKLLGQVDGANCDRTGVPIWSPDSNWITIYCWDTTIFFHRDGSDLHTINFTSYSDPRMVHWSPDSQYIGVKNTSGLQIAALDWETINIEATALGGRTSVDAEMDFDWSLDGNLVAYVDQYIRMLSDTEWDERPPVIMLTSMDREIARQISPADSKIWFYRPQWISNESLIVSGYAPAGEYGSPSRQLFGINTRTVQLHEYTPDLQVDAFSLSPTKQIVAFTSKCNLYVLDLLTNQNRLLLSDDAFCSVAEFGDYDLLWSSSEEDLFMARGNEVDVVSFIDGSHTVIDLGVEWAGLVDVR